MRGRLPRPVAQYLIICVALELCALASELMGFGPVIRHNFIVLGGFWPSVLRGEPSVYPGQAILMFVTSAFLHGSPIHLIMNMLGLVWLGPVIVRRLGPRSFWATAGLSAIGAGAFFALMSPDNMPMVGASGVLFGFLGSVTVWAVLDRLARKQSLMPIVQNAIGFLVLNIALMMIADANIAWQAHLGGFLAGVLVGAMTWRRQRNVYRR